MIIVAIVAWSLVAISTAVAAPIELANVALAPFCCGGPAPSTTPTKCPTIGDPMRNDPACVDWTRRRAAREVFNDLVRFATDRARYGARNVRADMPSYVGSVGCTVSSEQVERERMAVERARARLVECVVDDDKRILSTFARDAARRYPIFDPRHEAIREMRSAICA